MGIRKFLREDNRAGPIVWISLVLLGAGFIYAGDHGFFGKQTIVEHLSLYHGKRLEVRRVNQMFGRDEFYIPLDRAIVREGIIITDNHEMISLDSHGYKIYSLDSN